MICIMCIIVFKTTNTKLVLKTNNIVLKTKNKCKRLGIAQSMTFASYLIIKKAVGLCQQHCADRHHREQLLQKQQEYTLKK
jgi:hypothetical protein